MTTTQTIDSLPEDRRRLAWSIVSDANLPVERANVRTCYVTRTEATP